MPAGDKLLFSLLSASRAYFHRNLLMGELLPAFAGSSKINEILMTRFPSVIGLIGRLPSCAADLHRRRMREP